MQGEDKASRDPLTYQDQGPCGWQSLGEETSVWVKKAASQTDISLPPRTLLGSKTASLKHPSPWSPLWGTKCSQTGPVAKAYTQQSQWAS